jgi:hypothetical protein
MPQPPAAQTTLTFSLDSHLRKKDKSVLFAFATRDTRDAGILVSTGCGLETKRVDLVLLITVHGRAASVHQITTLPVTGTRHPNTSLI